MLYSKVHGLAAAAAVFAQGALAAAPLWGQCGGQGWTGDTQCVAGSTCSVQNQWYHQCLPGGGQPPNQGTPTVPSTPTTTGSGGGSQTTSVAATYTVDPSLPGNTIYRPVNMQAFSKMPVLVWGNGACSADSLSHHNFLIEIASWGVIAIANGTPRGSGGTSAQTMTNAITWAVNNAGKGTYANMVTSRLAAAGMSCGGIEAYAQAFDPRVTAIGIYNSGQYDAGGTQATVPRINKPIFFFMGGPSDIAYNNGMRDYRAVSSGVPAWVGNLPVGHGGTYGDPKGGKFGTAGQHWARWLLRGDTSAASFFTSAGARNDGWTVESKSLDRLTTTPI